MPTFSCYLLQYYLIRYRLPQCRFISIKKSVILFTESQFRVTQKSFPLKTFFAFRQIIN